MKNPSEYPELDASHRKAILDHMNKENPFWSFLGMELSDVRKGYARVRLPMKEELLQSLGVVHGGAIFSPADSAGAMSVLGMLDKDEYCITLEMKINYVKSFERGAIIAEGRIVSKGNRIAVSQVNIVSDEGDTIAQALGTFMIISKKDKQT